MCAISTEPVSSKEAVDSRGYSLQWASTCARSYSSIARQIPSAISDYNIGLHIPVRVDAQLKVTPDLLGDDLDVLAFVLSFRQVEVEPSVRTVSGRSSQHRRSIQGREQTATARYANRQFSSASAPVSTSGPAPTATSVRTDWSAVRCQQLHSAEPVGRGDRYLCLIH